MLVIRLYIHVCLSMTFWGQWAHICDIHIFRYFYHWNGKVCRLQPKVFLVVKEILRKVEVIPSIAPKVSDFDTYERT